MTPDAGVSPVPASPAPGTDGGTPVRELLARGEFKEAVDLAKATLKREGGARNEDLLVEAYLARIESLEELGLPMEARALTGMVQDRFGAALRRVMGASTVARIEELVRPLADPDLPADRKSAIEGELRLRLLDPAHLARARTLPEDHPLKVAARAVSRAFTEVTSGSVSGDPQGLDQIPRKSPLAPWKTLVRAIGAFHRGEDAAAREWLERIDPDSAPVALVPRIRSMVTPSVTGGIPRGALAAEIFGKEDALHERVKELDSALSSLVSSSRIKALERVVAALVAAPPDLAQELKARISIRCLLTQLPGEKVRELLGPPPRRTARFWRLLAAAYRRMKFPVHACAALDAFSRHAVDETLFSPDGPEVACVYRTMLSILLPIPEEEYSGIVRQFMENRDAIDGLYENQPPEIQRLAPGKTVRKRKPYYTNPEELFERAARLAPKAELFESWMAWARGRGASGHLQKAARAFSGAFPRDPRPHISLVEDGEARGDYLQALEHLDSLVRLDPKNPWVQRAQVRVPLHTVVALLKSGQRAAARALIPALEASQVHQEKKLGDLIHALKLLSEGEKPGAAPGRPLKESILLLGLQAATGARAPKAKRQIVPELLPEELLEAVVEANAQVARAELPFSLPPPWLKPLKEGLKSAGSRIGTGDLALLGDLALQAGDRELAYATTARGMERPVPERVPFLIVRARCLPSADHDRRLVLSQAAVTLARRSGDPGLIERSLDFWKSQLCRCPQCAAFPPQSHMEDAALEAALRAEERIRTIRAARARSTRRPWRTRTRDAGEQGVLFPPTGPGREPRLPSSRRIFEELVELLGSGFGLDPDPEIDPSGPPRSRRRRRSGPGRRKTP